MKFIASKKRQAFTLIEVLVVVALIAILAAITIIAINPAKSFRDARNAQRSSDVNAILNAVTQYTSTTNSTPAALGISACDPDSNPATAEVWGNVGTGAGNVNLATNLVENYLVAIPVDPGAGCNAADTCYDICSTAGDRVKVQAPGAEGVTIQVSR
jgi:prepilin-type N-terminal cleavage/methylation domain-containing protein